MITITVDDIQPWSDYNDGIIPWGFRGHNTKFCG